MGGVGHSSIPCRTPHCRKKNPWKSVRYKSSDIPVLTVVRGEGTTVHSVVPPPALLPARLRDIQAGYHGVAVETDLWAVLLYLSSLLAQSRVRKIKR